jgi:hypothetical protein
VVRTKSPAGGLDSTPPPGQAATGPAEPLDLGDDSPFSGLEPSRPAAGNYNPFDPATGGTAPPPAYDPVGYHPAAYGPPPGYPYPAPPGYPYPMPPGYGPPPGYAAPPGYPYAPGYDPAAAGYPMPPAAPAPAPAPVPDSVSEFKPGKEFVAVSDATAAHSSGKRAYRRGGSNKGAWIGVGVFLLIALVAGVAVGVPYVKKLKAIAANGNHGAEPGGQKGNASNPNRSNLVAGPSGLPRRLLFIHVSNYLYLNPLTNASVVNGSKGPDLTRPAADRLAYEWRVPKDKENNQVFVVADKERPMKSVVEGSYAQFFDTSRPQDRIVVYYGGHVVAKKVDEKDAAFLVPMEGDPEEVDTLIPLTDFYAKLKACKATQKVVIWDVARFNPERGRQRPGSEPLSEDLAKLLTETAPPNTQVILTCQPGENALEFYNQVVEAGVRQKTVAGSSFLGATQYVKGVGSKSLGENDPIPVDEWVGAVSKKVAEFSALGAAGEKEGKFTQTVKAFGAAQ